MNVFRVTGFSKVLPLAIVAGLIGDYSSAIAGSKLRSSTLRSSGAATRVQGQEEIRSDVRQVAMTTAASNDDDVFDRQLSPASAQVATQCAPTGPNCTNLVNPHSGTVDPNAGGLGASTDPSPLSPQPVPTAPQTLSDPNSVFSPQQQSQMPAPVTPLAAGQGASTAMSYVPAFMGDYFGGLPTMMTANGSSYGFLNSAGSAVVTTGNSAGIMKLAENTSPLPRDRVFLSYNYFSNVQLVPGGMAVNRLTPGVEKTFFNGNASVEVRVPMAVSLNSTTTLDGSGMPSYDTNQYELGNVTTFFKALLFQDEQFALSTGVGFAAPTANDGRIADSQGNTLGLIRNQAWHVLPFAGAVYTPNDRWYAQSMLQLDIATNGNSVATSNGGTLEKNGSLNDPTYIFGSVGTGYWLYTAPDPSARLSRVSMISELHFNSTLQHTDMVYGAEVNTGMYQSQIQNFSGVIGSNIIFDQNKSLLLGYVVPIGGGTDQAFSGEFRVLFNWYFGGVNRATRVQF